jgi:hypothetical protein
VLPELPRVFLQPIRASSGIAVKIASRDKANAEAWNS